MSKVWFVTGCSSGLGKSLAEAVLASGEKLAATARDISKLDHLKKYGENVLIMTLDVTDEKQAEDCVNRTVERFGRLDVLVNNAGYGQVAPFEQLSSADFRAQIDTNLYGVVNLTRAAIPYMRRQKSGYILQVSSVGGRSSTPGLSAYQAAKWAVGGFTEVIAKETKSFGIKVCTLEPGGIRTNWAARASSVKPDILPEYEPTVGAVLKVVASLAGKETSAPEKLAEVIISLTEKDELPAHLLLGPDAYHYAAGAEALRAKEMEQWKAVTVSTAEAGAEIPVMPLKD